MVTADFSRHDLSSVRYPQWLEAQPVSVRSRGGQHKRWAPTYILGIRVSTPDQSKLDYDDDIYIIYYPGAHYSKTKRGCEVSYGRVSYRTSQVNVAFTGRKNEERELRMRVRVPDVHLLLEALHELRLALRAALLYSYVCGGRARLSAGAAELREGDPELGGGGITGAASDKAEGDATRFSAKREPPMGVPSGATGCREARPPVCTSALRLSMSAFGVESVVVEGEGESRWCVGPMEPAWASVLRLRGGAVGGGECRALGHTPQRPAAGTSAPRSSSRAARRPVRDRYALAVANSVSPLGAAAGAPAGSSGNHPGTFSPAFSWRGGGFVRLQHAVRVLRPLVCRRLRQGSGVNAGDGVRCGGVHGGLKERARFEGQTWWLELRYDVDDRQVCRC
ncbi:hypothetical protein DFH09DRAFT_1421058 [Mycena vulgaris]|nr:hypothetical protein DFH09DRAFT_1421058 [Mycena vulgaris]